MEEKMRKRREEVKVRQTVEYKREKENEKKLRRANE